MREIFPDPFQLEGGLRASKEISQKRLLLMPVCGKGVICSDGHGEEGPAFVPEEYWFT